MKMASLKDISERYKGICESFIKKTIKTGLKDKGDSVFSLPENYIEIALMKIIESRGIEEVDIDYSEILQENPIDKSKWVPTLVYIDTDDALGVRWDKFLAYNTECGCIDVYEDSDTYESFYGQNDYVQTELYREVMDALGMEYVDPKTMYYQTLESFVGHVSRKRSSDLVSDIDYPDGVYILHETLGVRTVNEWNPKDNEGVTGILLIEDDHKIVVALEDSPEYLSWSKKRGLINQPIEEKEDAESDFNGDYYCQKLDSPDFPAAYYCKTYNKGGRSWYLPSAGELRLIYNHLEEVQNALETVGGQKFVTTWDEGTPLYWSSTEDSATDAWFLCLDNGYLGWNIKVGGIGKVRPVSNFSQNKNLKESFTKKIKSTRKSDLVSDIDYPDGVYILHETLGVRDVEGWNPNDNNGVVGILVVEDEHKIVVAIEDGTEDLRWSKKQEWINQPIEKKEDAESDFNGEEHCVKLNSPDFPAAYDCLNYNKGGRKWYLPSSGELWLIYRHLDEIQNALSIVGGQKFVTSYMDGVTVYWSSTECAEKNVKGDSIRAWGLHFYCGYLYGYNKVSGSKVRPVSNFTKNKNLKESFTKKISQKRNDELILKSDITSFVPDGVYILHETLGVRTVNEWNPKNNKGVVGILVIEDDHKIVVATEDAPERLHWSKKDKLVNEPIEKKKDAKSDFSGEYYCRKLNSPNYPVEYYCKTYNKGNRSWYLPSSGELWLIYIHLEEIQNALSIVGGQKLITNWDEGVPVYWSSTERGTEHAWYLNLRSGSLDCWGSKVGGIGKVRPVSKFDFSTLKESFTKKIKSTRSSDLNSKPSFELFDGVYIFHETLGVQDVEGWDSKNNDGVVGILVVDGEHRIVFATEESPERLRWTISRGEFNQIIPTIFKAESDFDGETYCRNLNSPKFPAAYYCLNYDKGGQKWYLPSAGELCLAYEYLDEIQTAMDAVGGQEFMTEWVASRNNRPLPVYWSSTEQSETLAWGLDFTDNQLYWHEKAEHLLTVRPVCKLNMDSLKESFTKKIKSTRKSDLVSDIDYPDGIYILHETLGVRTVDSWNPKDDEGVVGILVIEDDHKIVVALEDSPKDLPWLKECNRLINEPVEEIKDAESDFNGEIYCRRLDSPNYPAAWYCKTYNKGNRDWYLPSSGELWLICRHLEEIQNALETVGGQKFLITAVENDVPWYWSSTESFYGAWGLYLSNSDLGIYNFKVILNGKVRPVSNFNKNKNLKESFTRKISKTKDEELRIRADESILPKNYIELALMSVLCSAKKEGICFRKPKFRYKEDFGDVYELSEVFLQNDGFEIGSYEQNHYLEIEWGVYENGYMEEEPFYEVYPFKDEDDEIKIEIYKRVLQYLGMEYISPNIRWMKFDDEGFDYFDN